SVGLQPGPQAGEVFAVGAPDGDGNQGRCELGEPGWLAAVAQRHPGRAVIDGLPDVGGRRFRAEYQRALVGPSSRPKSRTLVDDRCAGPPIGRARKRPRAHTHLIFTHGRPSRMSRPGHPAWRRMSPSSIPTDSEAAGTALRAPL